MHSVIENGLEDFLAGVSSREESARIEVHLAECSRCREEVKAMREISEMFSSLRSADAPVPAPGFYARVVNRIEREQPVSFWASLFEPVFGKRMALASLLVLATLGTVLVSRETEEYAIGPSPEMIMAVEKDAPAAIDRDQMLYTLVSHNQ
jgi:predicted anti-sigma-YlaC factor YlaD